MAETAPLPPKESVHQAGGGQPAVEDRTIKEVGSTVLQYLEKIYATHASPADKQWHKDSIVEFLHHSQADKVTETSGDIAGQDNLDFCGFLRYMTSSAANALAPSLEQDLSWPLASYYVSSSHNTYLTGNQLASDSNADAYRNVLLRGCRCVEIDVWDGSDSDVESSDSSNSDEDSDSKEIKALRKASRKERIASKLPGSLTSRLEKTSLGKRITGKPAEASDSGEKKEGPITGTAPIKKSPNPQAVAIEPRVLHGYTLTKEVSFRDVCKAIRESAFVVTDLPLIVSLEVHCSQQQQEAMVRIINEVWKGLLLPQPDDDAKFLPAPGTLRHKILVKVKYVPPNKHTSTAEEESVDRSSPETKTATPTSSNATQKKVKKASKIIQALSALGVYTRGVSFKSLSQPEASMPTHIFSLSEGGVEEVHETEAAKLFEHNREYLMRTYPSGMRIGSSNLDPITFWRKGIQIVALNWQKWDEGMMLNEGMFAGTGGYVLKPEGYRGSKPITVPTNEGEDSGMQKEKEKEGKEKTVSVPAPEAILPQTLDLNIVVFAAQNIPLPEHDDKASGFKPYVKIELHTEPPHDTHAHAHAHHLPNTSSAKPPTSASPTRAKEGEYKARTKTQRGVDPDFKSEALAVAKGVPGVVPELAFVRFVVKDDEIGRDDLAAWACVRLDRLRTGYRFVHLLDRQGRESQGALLVRIDKKLA
ncbi:PLC-like phosphodiesterase [Hypoxylon sp. NC1633]|nr:PLC-like phosphodiesterase [Hypoxylon sp. NC1633]